MNKQVQDLSKKLMAATHTIDALSRKLAHLPSSLMAPMHRHQHQHQHQPHSFVHTSVNGSPSNNSIPHPQSGSPVGSPYKHQSSNSHGDASEHNLFNTPFASPSSSSSPNARQRMGPDGGPGHAQGNPKMGPFSPSSVDDYDPQLRSFHALHGSNPLAADVSDWCMLVRVCVYIHINIDQH